MTAQELLLKAHEYGITIATTENGGLLVAPTQLLTPKRVAAIKARKQDLLSFVADLERYGVATDPLILEALALFNGSLKGFVPTPRGAYTRRQSPASESEQQKPLGNPGGIQVGSLGRVKA